MAVLQVQFNEKTLFLLFLDFLLNANQFYKKPLILDVFIHLDFDCFGKSLFLVILPFFFR
jgi:hypothetical protein